MKKMLLSFLFLVTITFSGLAQLLSYNVDFPTESTNNFEITLDATKGNKGLNGHTPVTDVYVHFGVITNKSTSTSDWKYVKFNQNFTVPNVDLNATSLGSNKWKFTISNANGIRGYFGLTDPSETILKIAILFRNGTGTKKAANIDGSDMYIPIYTPGAYAVKFLTPAMQPTYVPIAEPVNITSVPTNLSVTAVSSKNSNITIRYDGTQIGNVSNGVTVSGVANVSTGCDHKLTLEGIDGATNVKDTINFFIYPTSTPTGARPVGRKDGITYENGNTEAVLILWAPGKQKVAVIGDFNNWSPTCATLMTKDGDYFWVRITGLVPGKKYAFQYVVDETIKTTEPYSELILDPWNDKWIPSANYPNIPAYPEGRTTGLASVLTPGDAPYNWTTPAAYGRPNKNDIMVYELLVRDFIATRNYKTLRDTLGYIKKLGFNAIELMPVNEFDGNESWGYNPNHFFALDKMYGTKNDFKAFIDKAHELGIAVILDVAFNHATGQSPMAAMWWNSSLNQPSGSNPYFYTVAQHPANVFNDFNHNQPKTREHVRRFIEYWMTEYRIDGFRWDLSKGFTNQNCGFFDYGCWNRYNQDRINIWKDYYGTMENLPVYGAGSYCILEHLGDWDEEAELAKLGMMLWGEMHEQFKQNAIGFPTTGPQNLDNVHWKNRSFWNDPYLDDKANLITYAVSHDKERMMVENQTSGNSFGGYNVKDLNTALRRSESMGGFLMSFPGPKMIWQFDEVGYDVSINACAPTWTTLNSNCRTDNKPVRWNYYSFGPRMRIFETYAAMAKLRNQFKAAFRSPWLAGGTNLSGVVKTIVVDANGINNSGLKYVAVCNFDVVTQNPTVTFPGNGTWYDYLNGGSINVTTGNAQISLPAGVFKIYLNQNVTGGVVTSLRNVISSNNEFKLSVSPNPVTSSAMVQYELPRSGKVELHLINVQGQVVASRNMGFQLKGIQTYQLNPSQLAGAILPSGQYILQVRVDNIVRYEKIMLQQKP